MPDLIFILLLIVSVPSIILFQKLTQLRLQIIPSTTLDPYPDRLQPLIPLAKQRLDPLGFHLCGQGTLPAFENSARIVTPLLLFQHPPSGTFALVSPIHQPETDKILDIEFHTWFQDHYLLTFNHKRHGLIGTPNRIQIEDPDAKTVAEQWQAHLKHWSQLREEHTVSYLTPQQAISSYVHHLNSHVKDLLEGNQIVPVSDRTYRLRLPLLWQLILGSVAGGRSGGQTPSTSTDRSSVFPDPPAGVVKQALAAAEIISIQLEQEKAIQTPPGGGQWKLLLFGGTLILFGLSFFPLFGELGSTFALMAVIFFHELGHWSAMRLFGYQDTSIFFIPFLGAAAIGSKVHARVWEQYIVLLGGPLPGLILGAILVIVSFFFPIGPGSLWIPMLEFMVLINYLNLLPFFPLDGGKIVELLLSSQSPIMSAALRGLAVLGLVMLSGGGGFLFILAVLIGIGIPSNFRQAQIAQNLTQHSLPEPTSEDTLEQTHALLQIFHEEYPKETIKFAERKGLISRVLKARGTQISGWDRAALLGIYLFTLLLGTIFTIVTVVRVMFLQIPA